MISILNIKNQRVQNMIEDTSSAAWYQQSMITSKGKIMWTVKECIDNCEHHLIRQIELHPDFYHSLLINKGLPPTSMLETATLQKLAV